MITRIENPEADLEAANEELADALRQVQVRRALKVQQDWRDAYEKVQREQHLEMMRKAYPHK